MSDGGARRRATGAQHRMRPVGVPCHQRAGVVGPEKLLELSRDHPDGAPVLHHDHDQLAQRLRCRPASARPPRAAVGPPSQGVCRVVAFFASLVRSYRRPPRAASRVPPRPAVASRACPPPPPPCASALVPSALRAYMSESAPPPPPASASPPALTLNVGSRLAGSAGNVASLSSAIAPVPPRSPRPPVRASAIARFRPQRDGMVAVGAVFLCPFPALSLLRSLAPYAFRMLRCLLCWLLYAFPTIS